MNELYERIVHEFFKQKPSLYIMENANNQNQSWEELRGLSWLFFDE